MKPVKFIVGALLTYLVIELMSTKIQKSDLQKALQDKNVQAFLSAIRFAEGTLGNDGYRKMFTGVLFNAPPWVHPHTVNSANGIDSTAAGAYQFIFPTWDEIDNALSLNGDFSPPMQDIGAVFLIRRRGALEEVLRGDFADAIQKVNKEWASLPGSPYGQPTKTLAQLQTIYQNAGGQLA